MKSLFLVALAVSVSLGPHKPQDKDQDGFPDAAELQSTSDRANFRRWFVAIALSSYENPRDEIGDCAGLVRFAYREALKAHDAGWREGFGDLLDPSIPEIKAFHYPDVPFIGTDIFRLAPGSYNNFDRAEGRFGNFADVPHLMRYHTRFLGRTLSSGIQQGDLLFFTPHGNPTHVMIYLEIGGEPYLLYHTGPGDEDEGSMRLVRFQTLSALEDENWRPDEQNPSFAGFYRFKILD